MLFRAATLTGIAEGRVTVAFRRWRRAPPQVGATLRTSVGVIAITEVSSIDEGDITADDLARSGLSVEDLRASLASDGTLWRIAFHLVGDDPRVALRDQVPTPDECDDLRARLRRLDAAAAEPWTDRYLRLVEAQPGIAARRLAAHVDLDVPRFKRRIRQLKELGLTESLDVGYRLSARGKLMTHDSRLG